VTTAGVSSSFFREADADAGFMPVTATKAHRHRESVERAPLPAGKKWVSPTAGGSPAMPRAKA
jgi:hypothetical protein